MELSVAELWSLFWPSVVAAVISAALCGALGFFVVLRRVAFVSAALSQVSGLGVALGFLLGGLLGHEAHGPTPLYLDPVVLALIFSGAVAATLASTGRVRRITAESVVGFVYLTAAALALVVLSAPYMAHEKHEVEDLLFGSSVAVSREHLAELVVTAIIVGLLLVVLFKELLFVSFDPEMARTLGIPVTWLELALTVAIGVSVAVTTRAIGALPVFGFLVLPSGAALLASSSVYTAMAISVLGAVLAAVLGFYFSLIGSWLPAGPMMVLCAAAYWLLTGAYRLAVRPRR